MASQGGYYRERPRSRLAGKLVLLIVGVIVVAYAFACVQMQSYSVLTNHIKIAQVHAVPTHKPGQMSIELITYDNYGNQISDTNYLVSGNRWKLEGDVIAYPSLLNIGGLHSGYKLTHLEGGNGNDDTPVSVIDLNGGDDNYFQTVHAQSWASPVVKATDNTGSFLSPDRKLYDVFATPDGLSIVPSR